MGGPNLEIFKFTLYLFVPLAALIHFGNPEWYRTKVVPYRDKLFHANRGNLWLPKDQSGVREELARIKAERLFKQAQREAEAEKNSKS